MSFFRSVSAIVVTLLLVGCDTGKVSSSRSGTKSPEIVSSADILTGALHQLRPENYGINSAVDKPISLLNSWRTKRTEVDGIVEQTIPVNAPPGWINTELESRLNQSKFDGLDAQHIRDALFYRVVSGYLSDRGSTELERVEIVVDFVCRNISLWRDDEIELPLRPFVALQLGRGSANDRAIVCAEILRQLRIDSMILRASSDTKETSNKWLLGVVVDSKIYLFDTVLGLPVFRSDDNAIKTPASFDEILTHPELLDLMSVKDPYRLKIEELREPIVFAISDPLYWCERMHRLEQSLPPNSNCVLYEPILHEDGKSGVIQRIAAAGRWNLTSLKHCAFQTQQEEKSRQLTQQAVLESQKLMVSLMAPISIKRNDDGKFVQEPPKYEMQRYRTNHLMGNFAEATQKYLSIRHLELERNIPPEIDQLNRIASEDAFYWSALCKMELEEYAAAVELFKSYLKKYDRKGKWFFSARSLLAACHAQLGEITEARSTLERSSSEDPYRITNAIRIKRWNSVRSKQEP